MRNIEIVELLLDKGAKVSAVDKVKLQSQFHVHYSHSNDETIPHFKYLLSLATERGHPSSYRHSWTEPQAG